MFTDVSLMLSCNVLLGISHTIHAMSLEDVEDGAHQGLPYDGGGAHPEPGTSQTSGAEERGTAALMFSVVGTCTVINITVMQLL